MTDAVPWTSKKAYLDKVRSGDIEMKRKQVLAHLMAEPDTARGVARRMDQETQINTVTARTNELKRRALVRPMGVKTDPETGEQCEFLVPTADAVPYMEGVIDPDPIPSRKSLLEDLEDAVRDWNGQLPARVATVLVRLDEHDARMENTRDYHQVKETPS